MSDSDNKGRDWIESALKQSREAIFEQGDRWDVFDTLVMCLDFDLKPPKWLLEEIATCWGRYTTGEAESLGDAFGIPSIPHRKALNKNFRTFAYVWQYANEAIHAGTPIDQGLFEEVADKVSAATGIKISASYARDTYYRMKRVTNND